MSGGSQQPFELNTSTGANRPSGKLWDILATGLVLLSVGLSGVLLARHFAITSGMESVDVCSKFFQSDCDSAIQSNVSVQFGIPLAGLGIVHFSMVGVSMLLRRTLRNSFKTEATLAATILCAIGVVVGGVLTWTMLRGDVGFCAICLLIHALNVLLLMAVVRGADVTWREMRGSVGGVLRYLMGGTVEDESLVRWKILGLICVGLVGVVSYQWVLIQYDRRMGSQSEPTLSESVVEEFRGQPTLEIPVGDNDPRLGKETAPAATRRVQ